MNTLLKQRHRINHVINYVRSQLSSELDLDLMSEVAKQSKYHFSRVFSTCLHETPNQYVVRVRLEKTAMRLVRPDAGNITQIALDYGFSGSDTFSRSFKQRYDCSPREFKTQNKMHPSELKIDTRLKEEIIKPGYEVLLRGFTAPKVEVQRRPDYFVAYIRHFGPYGDIGISDTYTSLEQWTIERGIHIRKSSFIGRSYDNSSVTAARRCTYDACIVLDDNIAEDDVISSQIIPGGLFAVCNVVCEPAQINRMWDWLIEKWLPESRYKLNPIPPYEFYPAQSDFIIQPSQGNQVSLQLCLPII